jgi:hypothetical protein
MGFRPTSGLTLEQKVKKLPNVSEIPLDTLDRYSDQEAGGTGGQDALGGTGTAASWIDWTKIPGHENFFTPGVNAGDASTDSSIDMTKLRETLSAQGMKLFQSDVRKGAGTYRTRWVQDKNGKITSIEAGLQDDSNFWNASMALVSAVMPAVLGLGSGGSAALTAGLGAANAAAGGASGRQILKGALTSALTSYLGGQAGSYVGGATGSAAAGAASSSVVSNLVRSAITGQDVNAKQMLLNAIISGSKVALKPGTGGG